MRGLVALTPRIETEIDAGVRQYRHLARCRPDRRRLIDLAISLYLTREEDDLDVLSAAIHVSSDRRNPPGRSDSEPRDIAGVPIRARLRQVDLEKGGA